MQDIALHWRVQEKAPAALKTHTPSCIAEAQNIFLGVNSIVILIGAYTEPAEISTKQKNNIKIIHLEIIQVCILWKPILAVHLENVS